MKTIRDFKLKGKTVLLRCDFNVPLDHNGDILSDLKIRRTLPTIEYLKKKGAHLILLSHRSDNRSLDSAWQRLAQYTDITSLEFLENIRRDEREKKNSIGLAKELAALADIYVNDAFSVCHRKHASVVAITKYLPSAAGLLLEEEVGKLTKLVQKAKKPIIVIIGGSKSKSKGEAIPGLFRIADKVLIGGKLAFDLKLKSDKLVKPIDYVGRYDIGQKTIKLFLTEIASAGLIIWAGPMGKFEDQGFEKGTKEIGKAVAKSKAVSIVGGGHTISALKKFNLKDKVTYISSGGGAMLTFLAQKPMPGLEVL